MLSKKLLFFASGKKMALQNFSRTLWVSTIFRWALIFIFKIINAELLLACCKQVCFKTICKRTNVCDVLHKFLLFPCRMPWFVHLVLFPIRKRKPIYQQKCHNYDVFRCKTSHPVKRTMSAIEVTTSMVTKIDVIYFLCDHIYFCSRLGI